MIIRVPLNVPPCSPDQENKEGKIQKFKSKGKKKQILLLMNDNYDKVKNFLSSNKINLSKMEDLVKVVEFYNNI